MRCLYKLELPHFILHFTTNFSTFLGRLLNTRSYYLYVVDLLPETLAPSLPPILQGYFDLEACFPLQVPSLEFHTLFHQHSTKFHLDAWLPTCPPQPSPTFDPCLLCHLYDYGDAGRPPTFPQGMCLLHTFFSPLGLVFAL